MEARTTAPLWRHVLGTAALVLGTWIALICVGLGFMAVGVLTAGVGPEDAWEHCNAQYEREEGWPPPGMSLETSVTRASYSKWPLGYDCEWALDNGRSVARLQDESWAGTVVFFAGLGTFVGSPVLAQVPAVVRYVGWRRTPR